jgi:hypothetical protein
MGRDPRSVFWRSIAARHRHCERSEAIQDCIRGKILDCFAALAMTVVGEASCIPNVVPDKRSEAER